MIKVKFLYYLSATMNAQTSQGRIILTTSRLIPNIENKLLRSQRTPTRILRLQAQVPKHSKIDQAVLRVGGSEPIANAVPENVRLSRAGTGPLPVGADVGDGPDGGLDGVVARGEEGCYPVAGEVDRPGCRAEGGAGCALPHREADLERGGAGLLAGAGGEGDAVVGVGDCGDLVGVVVEDEGAFAALAGLGRDAGEDCAGLLAGFNDGAGEGGGRLEEEGGGGGVLHFCGCKGIWSGRRLLKVVLSRR